MGQLIFYAKTPVSKAVMGDSSIRECHYFVVGKGEVKKNKLITERLGSGWGRKSASVIYLLVFTYRMINQTWGWPGAAACQQLCQADAFPCERHLGRAACPWVPLSGSKIPRKHEKGLEGRKKKVVCALGDRPCCLDQKGRKLRACGKPSWRSPRVTPATGCLALAQLNTKPGAFSHHRKESVFSSAMK